MIDFLIGLFIGGVIFVFLSPYFFLWYLKDIAENIESLKNAIEKAFKGRSEDDN